MTLFEYYQGLGLPLPSLSQRAENWKKMGNTDTYTGTADQNARFLKFAQSSSRPDLYGLPVTASADTSSTGHPANAELDAKLAEISASKTPEELAQKTQAYKDWVYNTYLPTHPGENAALTIQKVIGAGQTATKGFQTTQNPTDSLPPELLTHFDNVRVLQGGGYSDEEILAMSDEEVANLAQKSTGDPAMDSTLKAIQDYLTKLGETGKTINPYVDITPEKLAEFLGQAQREIDPYYASQMGLARENLLNQLGYSKEEVGRFEGDLEKKYGKSLTQLGETSAEQGMALSGRRLQEEGELATETQNQMLDTRRKLAFEAGNQARQFAGEWGGANIPMATMTSTPKVQAGESSFRNLGGTETPLYELSDSLYQNLTGAKQWEQQANVKTRQAQLEEAFKTNELANRTRTLNL